MSIAATFTDLGIRAKIFCGFGSLLVIAGGLAGFGTYQMSEIHHQVSTMQDVTGNMQRVLTVNHDIETMRRAQILYRFDGDKEQLKEFAAAEAEARNLLAASAKAALSEDRRRIYSATQDSVTDLGAMMRQFVELVDRAASERTTLTAGEDALTAAAARLVAEAHAAHDPALSDAAAQIERAILLVRVANWRFLAVHDRSGVGTLNTNADKALAAITAMEKIANEGIVAVLPSIRNGLTDYVSDFNAASSVISKSNDLYDQQMRPKMLSVQKDLATAAASLTRRYETTSQDIDAGFSTIALVHEVIAVFAMIFGVVLAMLVGRGIAGPVSRMAGAMRKLADGDLTVEVPESARRDEIGAMAEAMGIFQRNAIEAARRVDDQEAERVVKQQRAANLEILTGAFEKTAGDLVAMVSSAAAELQVTATSMTGTAGQTTQQATTVAAAAEEASVNVQTVASAAEELAASIGEISRQVGQSARIAGKAVEDAKRTDTVVRALAEGAQKIGEVVGLISNIAGQTNLLALNATIEAARAGDAGKGFAVVASEVKSLATQTAKATDDIGRHIAQIQAATKEAVESIQSIGSTIGEVSEIAANIAAAVEEQGAATQEIARNVQQAAIGTTEVTSTITGVSQGAHNTGVAATQVLGAAEELSRQSARLSGEVGRFIAGVKAA